MSSGGEASSDTGGTSSAEEGSVASSPHPSAAATARAASRVACLPPHRVAPTEVSSSRRRSDSEEEEAEKQRAAFRPRTLSSVRTPSFGAARHHSAASLPPAPHQHRSHRPRVLVTGGAGFIGSHVARALLSRGEDVAIVDELNDYYDPALKLSNLQSLLDEFGQRRVHVYVADICDLAAMEACFVSEKPDRIVHLAARAGVRPSIQDPLLYEQANVKGTLTLLTLARKFNIEHFVYASSSSVYGDDTPAPFSELHPCNAPVSPYAATKKACELLAHSHAHLHNLPCSGLRFFTVYGEGGRRDMAPFMFIDLMARGQTIQMFGDGTSQRDYTYVSDIVAGVLAVLDHPPGRTIEPSDPTNDKVAMHEVYNLGVGSPITLRDFIAEIGTALGVEPHIKQLPKQPGDVELTFADISKAQRMVGYEPRISVREGIKKTVAWYLKAVASNNNNNNKQPSTATPQFSLKDSTIIPSSANSNSTPVAFSTPSFNSSFPPLVSSLCGTRIHNNNSGTGNGFARRLGLSPDVVAHLMSWLPRALSCAQYVAIAVDTTDARNDILKGVESILRGLDSRSRARVSIVCVSPWGAFCPALNALLSHAQSLNCSTILYSSLEMAMHPAHIHALNRHLDSSTLVVGARLSGHRFVRGTATLDGCSTIWNTLALWSTTKLARTGFLPVSDGVPEVRTISGEEREQGDEEKKKEGAKVIQKAVSSGVEEVACISMQQLLYPNSAQAKLLSMTCDETSNTQQQQQQQPPSNTNDNSSHTTTPNSHNGSRTPNLIPSSSSFSFSSSASHHHHPHTNPLSTAAVAAIATTSAGDTETSEEEEEEELQQPGGRILLTINSGSMLHGTRMADASSRKPFLAAPGPSPASQQPHHQQQQQQLYDDVATPGSTSHGNNNHCLEVLTCTRTVSAPHAIALPPPVSIATASTTTTTNVVASSPPAVFSPFSFSSSSSSSSSLRHHAPSASPSASTHSPSLKSHLSSNKDSVSFPPPLRIPSLHWDADFSGDHERQAAHDRKMRSKIERAQQQLQHLQLKAGTVQHIHCSLTAQ